MKSEPLWHCPILRFILLTLLLAFTFQAKPVSAEEGFLETSDGVKLFYEYFQASPQKGAIVLLHGWGTSYNEWSEFREFLNKNGWSTIAIDFRGHGASTERGEEYLNFEDFGQAERGKMLSIDIAAARNFLGDVKPIWLIGSSFGAALGFSYAVRQKDILGVVLLSPALEYPEQGYQVEMSKYGNRPILVATSQDDDARAFDSATFLNKYAQGEAKFIQYETAGHGTRMFDFDKELKDKILQWLDQNSK